MALAPVPTGSGPDRRDVGEARRPTSAGSAPARLAPPPRYPKLEVPLVHRSSSVGTAATSRRIQSGPEARWCLQRRDGRLATRTRQPRRGPGRHRRGPSRGDGTDRTLRGRQTGGGAAPGAVRGGTGSGHWGATTTRAGPWRGRGGGGRRRPRAARPGGDHPPSTGGATPAPPSPGARARGRGPGARPTPRRPRGGGRGPRGGGPPGGEGGTANTGRTGAAAHAPGPGWGAPAPRHARGATPAGGAGTHGPQRRGRPGAHGQTGRHRHGALAWAERPPRPHPRASPRPTGRDWRAVDWGREHDNGNEYATQSEDLANGASHAPRGDPNQAARWNKARGSSSKSATSPPSHGYVTPSILEAPYLRRLPQRTTTTTAPAGAAGTKDAPTQISTPTPNCTHDLRVAPIARCDTRRSRDAGGVGGGGWLTQGRWTAGRSRWESGSPCPLLPERVPPSAGGRNWIGCRPPSAVRRPPFRLRLGLPSSHDPARRGGGAARR